MHILPSYMILFHYVSGYKPDYITGKTSGIELKRIDTVLHTPIIERASIPKENEISIEYSILGNMNNIEDFLLIEKLKKIRED